MCYCICAGVAILFRSALLFGCLVAVVSVTVTGSLTLEQRLPLHLAERDITTEFVVISLPKRNSLGWRFDALVYSPVWQGRARLNLYRHQPVPRLGERWQATLRLKPANGYANPGGFDYLKYLTEHGLLATGYVRNAPLHRLAQSASLRALVLERLQPHLLAAPSGSLLWALLCADKQFVEETERDALQGTGTAHLLAISGMHIGLVFAAVWWLCRLLGRCGGRWRLLMTRLSVWVALAAALGYGYLAGFLLPTQRALLMLLLAVVAAALLFRLSLIRLLLLTACAVALVTPLSLYGPSFLLSFTAVAVIALVVWRWPAPRHRASRWQWLWYALRMQLLLSLSMGLVASACFGQFSVSSVLANSVAIPVVSYWVLPLTLLGSLFTLLSPQLGAWLLYAAGQGLTLLLDALSVLAKQKWSSIELSQLPPSWFVLVLLVLSCILIAHRRHWPVLLLAAGLTTIAARFPEQGRPNTWRLTVLDVGQGLAVVIETSAGAILYDTGDRYRSGFSLAEAVIAPYLQMRGYSRLEGLIVSHADKDHAGGARFIRQRFLPRWQLGVGAEAQPCVAGQQWRFDQLSLEVLWPPQAVAKPDNHDSCVIRVSDGVHSVLLSGDIDRAAELALVQASATLRAEVLVVPHHGSDSSSSDAFIAAVSPQVALFSQAYFGRFDFPAASVSARYRQNGVAQFQTATDGALMLSFDQPPFSLTRYRQDQAQRWYRPDLTVE